MMVFPYIVFAVVLIVVTFVRLTHIAMSAKRAEKLAKSNKKRFDSQCWYAKLRRETEPTWSLHYNADGHRYVGIWHNFAEAPAVLLSMERMIGSVQADEKKQECKS